VTPQRRSHIRAKQDNRRTRGPGARPKPGSAPPAARHSVASMARSTAAPPLTPRGSRDRLAAAAAAVLPPGPELARRALPPAEPSLLERAERLRDDLLRSKLTHPDPWSYTAKARAWAEHAQTLVQDIAIASQTPELHAMVAKLAAEVENDPDYQKARQLF
jgi:hypothetical protein